MSTLTTLTPRQVSLRWLMQSDLPQVLRIERDVPGCRWTEADFLAALRSIETIGQVAEVEDRVVGYVIYQAERPAEHGSRQIESAGGLASWWPPAQEQPRPAHISLLNIAVAPRRQHQGIGRELLGRLAQKLEQGGGWIRTMVPETNLACQLFLRSAGFRALKVMRDYYGGEDAYLMECRKNGRFRRQALDTGEK